MRAALDRDWRIHAEYVALLVNGSIVEWRMLFGNAVTPCTS